MALLISTCALAACGYTFVAPPHPGAVEIGRVENHTLVPGLGDQCVASLRQALGLAGMRTSSTNSNAPESAATSYRITGTLASISVSPITVRDGVMVKSEITVSGRFTLRAPDGSEIPLRDAGHFIVAYASSAPVGQVLTERDEALVHALASLANEVVAAAMQEMRAREVQP